MTQLILNGGIALPETSKDKYRCYPSILNQQVEMISGRLVEEVRGTVQMIEYSYDYMGNELMRAVLEVLRSGGLPAGQRGPAGEQRVFVHQPDPAHLRVFPAGRPVLAQFRVHLAGGQTTRMKMQKAELGRVRRRFCDSEQRGVPGGGYR